jgi:hypothetical protein
MGLSSELGARTLYCTKKKHTFLEYVTAVGPTVRKV